MNTLPTLGSKLTKEHISFLQTFATSARRSILEMTTNANSGHPGGSLSMIDFLTVLYAGIIAKTGDPVVISNGHTSPAVYAVLAEMGYIPKKDAIEGFRKAGSVYEGHVSRHVPGVWFGTGPLGAGVSAGSGFAWAQKYAEEHRTPLQLPPKRGESNPSSQKVYCTIGDGETEEGQVYEMMHVAKKYSLDNLVVFLDYNRVQLSDSLDVVMPYDPKAHFLAAGWHVIDVDGHDYQALWSALSKAHNVVASPVCIVGNTVMGKGVDFMEQAGAKHKATWHGKAASQHEIEPVLNGQLALSAEQEQTLQDFRKQSVTWKPGKPVFPEQGSPVKMKTGKTRVYTAGEVVDCRTAYGNALLDLAKVNKHVVALTADLAGSVKTDGVERELPAQHIDVGVAEQQMVSMSGGMSLVGIVPFCSTFGAFMTSRAKDQARVNDINNTNVKMVATHCGLSVGEDGPTHQAIDDSGSMLGLLNTMQIEPSDANQCDRMVRYSARHYGNVYMRMGRHKLPVLTTQKGEVLFDASYEYYYGRCDVLRKGTDVTIACMGGTVAEALFAWDTLRDKGISAEVVIVSSIKQFDTALFSSIKKTGRVLIVEDHASVSGLATQLSAVLREKKIAVESFASLGVREYQMSGTWEELYALAKIDRKAIVGAVQRMMK